MTNEEKAKAYQQQVLKLLQEAGASESKRPSCRKHGHYALGMVRAPWISSATGDNAEGMPLLPLVCLHCSNVRFFSAEGLKSAADRLKGKGKEA